MANETSHDDPKFWIQSLQRVVVLKVRLGRDNRTQTNMNLT